MTRREFYDAALKRLEAGALEYGNQSFSRPTDDLVREVTEELLDVAVWCAIMMSAADRGADAPGAHWHVADIVRASHGLTQRLAHWSPHVERTIGGTPEQAAAWLRATLEIE